MNFHTFSFLGVISRFLGIFCLVVLTASAQTPVAVTRPLVESGQARFRFTGTITSLREADITPRVAGLVAKANADMGFAAKHGDVLVILDDTLARMNLREKRLNLEAAQAELANAERRLKEATDLGDNNFPRSERENRETIHRRAEITVARLRTNVETQEEIVERHKILAPFDGVVVEKRAEVGEWVTSGSSVLSFVDTENLRLDIQVPQEQVELTTESHAVTVRLAGDNRESFDASIEARSPLIDPQTRTFQVRIRLAAPPSRVKPGMSAEAIFYPASNKANLKIPRDAILRTANDEVMVWITRDSGTTKTASRRTVELGSTTGNFIEVLSGLNATDEVIYQGNESLQEGQEIRIVDSITPSPTR